MLKHFLKSISSEYLTIPNVLFKVVCPTVYCILCSRCIFNTIYCYKILRFFQFPLFFSKIDDPLDAIPVHGAGGIWGTLAVYLFKWGGLFLSGSSEAALGLAWNVIGLIAIIAWTGLNSFIMFSVLKKLKLLRVEPAHEFKGM